MIWPSRATSCGSWACMDSGAYQGRKASICFCNILGRPKLKPDGAWQRCSSVICVEHRTSGTILAKQMEYARLNKRLDDIVDIVSPRSMFPSRLVSQVTAIARENVVASEAIISSHSSVQTYLDAPNLATGPLPDGFKASIFPGPYYEWWSAEQVW